MSWGRLSENLSVNRWPGGQGPSALPPLPPGTGASVGAPALPAWRLPAAPPRPRTYPPPPGSRVLAAGGVPAPSGSRFPLSAAGPRTAWEALGEARARCRSLIPEAGTPVGPPCARPPSPSKYIGAEASRRRRAAGAGERVSPTRPQSRPKVWSSGTSQAERGQIASATKLKPRGLGTLLRRPHRCPSRCEGGSPGFVPSSRREEGLGRTEPAQGAAGGRGLAPRPGAALAAAAGARAAPGRDRQGRLRRAPRRPCRPGAQAPAARAGSLFAPAAGPVSWPLRHVRDRYPRGHGARRQVGLGPPFSWTRCPRRSRRGRGRALRLGSPSAGGAAGPGSAGRRLRPPAGLCGVGDERFVGVGRRGAPGPGLWRPEGGRGHAAEEALLRPGSQPWDLARRGTLGEASFSRPGLTLCSQVSHGIKRIGCVGHFAGNFSLFPYFLPARGPVEQLLSLPPRRLQARVWTNRGSAFSGWSAHSIPGPTPVFPPGRVEPSFPTPCKPGVLFPCQRKTHPCRLF